MTTLAAAWLFDLDGTLADTLEDIAASANHVRALAGLGPLPLAGVRAIVGDGARALCTRALAGNPLGRTVDDVFDAWREHHADQCTRTVRAYPGVREFLTRLRAAGHPCAVVTNKPEHFARRIVTHLGLDELLPVVIGGDTTPAHKPSPVPLYEALRRLAVGAHGATMVGDGEQDIRAGKAAGCRTIALLGGFRDEAVLRAERPDLVWRDLVGHEPLHDG